MSTMTETERNEINYRIALVIDNYEDLCDERRALVAEHLQGPDREYPNLLGEKLRDWVRDIIEPIYETGPMLAQEMLRGAIDTADWDALAQDYTAAAQEG